ncbi:MAG TPA: S41 family peptidase [Pirellulales bacterium]|jgi:carboxyl-terminal processing protease|nr:S41 family peptidase [Pirellulales bacterium]
MFAFATRPWTFVFLLLAASVSLGDEPNSASRPALLAGDQTEFARRAFQIAEIVLDKHVEPPTRQEMLLCGLTAIHHDRVPDGLSRAVSAVAKEDDFVACLIRFWPASDQAGSVQTRAAFLHGMSQAVPGGLDFTTSKEAAVERQLAANQYVGIGIALNRANQSKLYQIGATFPRGPVAKAGIAVGESILEVDGVKTEDLSMVEVVDRLRGPEGTTVTLRVARDASGESRLVTLTRSLVPIQTVTGYRQLGPESWEPVIAGDLPVAYLRIEEIGGSTVSELREYEAELAAKKVELLVLDLRRADGHELRHCIMLVDALLEGDRAGIIRYRDRSTSCVRLDRDCLFRGWKMAVLVDNHTRGYGEWLAGLLQSQRKAVVVGQPTTGSSPFVWTPVELPNNWGVMRLATAVLERDQTAANGYGYSPATAGKNIARWSTGMVASLLSRITSANGAALNRLYCVTPDVETESAKDQVELEGAERHNVRNSQIVTRAIEALTAPIVPKNGPRDVGER